MATNVSNEEYPVKKAVYKARVFQSRLSFSVNKKSQLKIEFIKTKQFYV